ncbi:hypothetical protein MCEMSE15_02593 [Fimbriimonadaceae bacterium]
MSRYISVDTESTTRLMSCLNHSGPDGMLGDHNRLDRLASPNLTKADFDLAHYKFELISSHTGYR